MNTSRNTTDTNNILNPMADTVITPTVTKSQPMATIPMVTKSQRMVDTTTTDTSQPMATIPTVTKSQRMVETTTDTSQHMATIPTVTKSQLMADTKSMVMAIPTDTKNNTTEPSTITATLILPSKKLVNMPMLKNNTKNNT